MSTGSIHVEPSQDTVVCVTRRLNNEAAQYVRHVEASLGANSHHLVVYRVDDIDEDPTPTPCVSFGTTGLDEKVAPMLVAQESFSALDMPSNVGLHIDQYQMIRLEYHVVNASTAPIDVQANVTFVGVDETDDITPADLLFWGTLGISLAPHSPGSADFFHMPWDGIHIFGLTSHMHRLGTEATISIATDPSGNPRQSQDVQLLHHQRSWSEPGFTSFNPPLQLGPNQGFHLHCNYNNTTDRTVTFGLSSTDEMCLMWAYYYPSRGRGLQLCYQAFADRNPESTQVTCNPP